jgi:hypothetical protein
MDNPSSAPTPKATARAMKKSKVRLMPTSHAVSGSLAK